MTEGQGVEIDYCQNYRGIWLDRGELDKIIEKSSQQANHFDYQSRSHHDDHKHHDNQKQHDYYQHHRKKTG
jgi:Zn-finger nucleic acid-binding protein